MSWNFDLICSLSDEQNFKPGNEWVNMSGLGSTQATKMMFDRVVRVVLKHCTSLESTCGYELDSFGFFFLLTVDMTLQLRELKLFEMNLVSRYDMPVTAYSEPDSSTIFI